MSHATQLPLKLLVRALGGVVLGLLLISDGRGQTLVSTTTIFNGGVVPYPSGTLSIDGVGFPTLFLQNGATLTSGITSLTIGGTQSGALNLSGGSTLTNSGPTYLGGASGSVGIATVTGTNSFWGMSNEFNVGYAGNGTLNIQNGGRVTSLTAYLGRNSSSTGAVTISGANSEWLVSESLNIGSTGRGILTITGGGTVTSGSVNLGNIFAGSGTAMLSGSGSRWTITNDLSIGGGGAALGSVVTVSDTAALIVGGKLTLRSGGTLRINGGNVTTHSFVQSANTLRLDDGTFTVSSGVYTQHTGAANVQNIMMINGSTSTAAPRFQLIDSATTLGVESLIIAATNQAELFIGGGSTFTVTAGELSGGFFIAGSNIAAGVGYIGLRAGSSGTLTVDGANTRLTLTSANASSIVVGAGGNGALLITNGGRVVSDDATVASSSTAVGSATIRGTDSQWTIAHDLIVGNFGTANLIVDAGGRLSSSTAVIGKWNGSSGTVTVTGASSLWSSSTLTNIGMLNIFSGGQVTSRNASVSGEITIDGANSQWTVTGDLRMRSLAVIVIQNGGALLSSTSFQDDSLAIVTGPNSIWNVSVDLKIGNSSSSTAELRIENGGIVESPKIEVGVSGSGSLLVQNAGELTADIVTIAASTGTGIVVISGTNTQSFVNDFRVGQSGAGKLFVQNGAHLIGADGTIGQASSSASGIVTVEGADSRWTLTDGFSVSNTGTLNVLNGGAVASNVAIVTSRGTVNISGTTSRLDVAGEFSVGRQTGIGTLNILNGGNVTSLTGSCGISGEANILVANLNSRWSVTNSLYIATNGTGTLSIQSGGQVVSGTAHIGFLSSGKGSVIISGVGSQWSVLNSLYVGTSTTNAGGRGALTIDSGGSLVIGGTLKLWDTGTLNLNGGSVIAENFDRSVGNYSLNDGTLTVSGGVYTHTTGSSTVNNILTINGNTPTALPIFELTGGATAVGVEAVIVGSTNQGSLVISGGSVLTNTGSSITLGTVGGVSILRGNGDLGLLAGSTGTAVITGAGSQWTLSGDLRVGRFGTGVLAIQDGGKVSSSLTFLGSASSGAGTATLTGANSQLSTYNLYVGSSGTGVLNVLSGAQVSGNAGIIAEQPSGRGVVTISGTNSQWTLTQDLRVGYSGTGVLNVLNGGRVTSSVGSIGNGTATISGLGSQWTVTGGLTLVSSGSSILNVQNGGNVSSGVGTIGGSAPFGKGVATISGTNSQWSTSSLNIGSLGTGELIVQDGGRVVSTNDGSIGLQASDFGKVTISGANSAWFIGDTLEVGSFGTGVMNVVNGGRVTSSFGYIGSGGDGTVTVSGASSEWTLMRRLFVGSSATGVLNVQDGGRITQTAAGADRVTLGINSSGRGTAVVSGPTTRWDYSGEFIVGSAGLGRLEVSGGATLAGEQGLLGEKATGIGTVTITGGGSQWILTEGLTIAESGQARLEVFGGTVTSRSGAISTSPVGTGTASLSGMGSRWLISQQLIVGQTGNGTLEILANASVVSSTASVGQSSSAIGSVLVSGAGSIWTVSNSLFIGGSTTTPGGSGIVTVSDGGALEVGRTLKLWSSGTLNINGGSVTTFALDRGRGAVNLNDGTLTVSGGMYTHTTNSGRAGNVLSINGNTPTALPMFEFAGGAKATRVEALVVGSTAGGRLIVSGSSLLSMTGTGVTLDTIDGASIAQGDGYLAISPGSTGDVLVTDTGSRWSMSGSLYIGGRETSSGGTGSLTVTGGGSVVVGWLTKIWDQGSVRVGSGGTLQTGTLEIIGGGQFTVDAGGTFLRTGGQKLTVGGLLNANGAVAGLVTVADDGILKGNGSVGAIVVAGGGTISVGNSVGSLTIDGSSVSGGPSLQFDAGSTIVFEFNNATGTLGGVGGGGGWDYIELGAGTLTLNAQNLTLADRITIMIDSLTLANLHGTAANFDPLPDGGVGTREYYWKVIGVNNLSQILTPGSASISDRFAVIDDQLNAGVFGAGNPFTRPSGPGGQGTFDVLAGSYGQGTGLYVHYSYYQAVPEPGSMLLVGCGSLFGAWYGRRRRKQSAATTNVTQ